MEQNTPYLNIQNTLIHYNWLREQSPCYRYPSPYQQLYDAAISGDTKAKPLNVEINGDKLTITWDEQPIYKSIYDIPSILNQIHSSGRKEISEKNYWDKETLENIPIPQYVIENGYIHDDTWLAKLDNLGFILLKDTDPGTIKSFFGKISLLNQHYFGNTFDLDEKDENENKKDHRQTGEKGGCALPPHNDLTFWGDHKLLQFFYCEKSSPIGGDSILVDGFQVGEKIRQAFPEYFQSLTTTTVEFCLEDPKHQYRFKHPSTIIECDYTGQISNIRFSKRNCRPYFMPSEKASVFYEAYNTFFRYLKDTSNQFTYHIEPNDCLIFQNFRLLHGRTAFDLAHGGRKLHSGYYDWKYFEGRLNYLKES